MIVASVCLVLALELAVVGWPASSLRRVVMLDRSALLDVGMFILLAGAYRHAAVWICSLGVLGLAERGTGWLVGHAPAVALHGIPGVVLWLLGADFLYYWVHRAFHSRFLWPIHRVHHSAPTLTPMTYYRQHPANLVTDPAVLMLPTILAVPSPFAGGVIGAVAGFHLLLIHSAIRWDYGFVGRWLLVSPGAHRIHHSFDRADYDRNFATMFPIWDRLFGTWRNPATTSTSRIAAQSRQNSRCSSSTGSHSPQIALPILRRPIPG